MTRPARIAWLFSVALLAAAQQTAPDPLLRWMDGIAQKQLAGRERVIAGIRTPAEAERRRQTVRAKLLEIIGGRLITRGR